jgi:hypothetical protein
MLRIPRLRLAPRVIHCDSRRRARQQAAQVYFAAPARRLHPRDWCRPARGSRPRPLSLRGRGKGLRSHGQARPGIPVGWEWGIARRLRRGIMHVRWWAGAGAGGGAGRAGVAAVASGLGRILSGWVWEGRRRRCLTGHAGCAEGQSEGRRLGAVSGCGVGRRGPQLHLRKPGPRLPRQIPADSCASAAAVCGEGGPCRCHVRRK